MLENKPALRLFGADVIAGEVKDNVFIVYFLY